MDQAPLLPMATRTELMMTTMVSGRAAMIGLVYPAARY